MAEREVQPQTQGRHEDRRDRTETDKERHTQHSKQAEDSPSMAPAQRQACAPADVMEISREMKERDPVFQGNHPEWPTQ